MIKFTDKEKEWLKKYFPQLIINQDKNKFYYVEGSLEINAIYDLTEKKCILFPPEEQKKRKEYIHDFYEVRIINNDSFIPDVYELSGRLKSVAVKRNIPEYDLHINPSKSNLCLCPKPQEKVILKQNYSFSEFLTKLVIPFFYAQSFNEKYGYWPWGEYSHGDLGILECYYDFATQQKDNLEFLFDTIKALPSDIQALVKDRSVLITRQTLCPWCNNRMRNCHKKAWKGLKQLKKDYKTIIF